MILSKSQSKLGVIASIYKPQKETKKKLEKQSKYFEINKKTES